jgi:hypothetical protein
MDTTPQQAVLVSGYARIEAANLVGMTVACARSMYKLGASIPESARATLNGRVVTGDAIIGDGDVLVFDEPTGTKGQ